MDPPCGNWTPYKNEKCIKLINKAGLQNKENAEFICSAFAEDFHTDNIPQLVTINTQVKQQFLENLLFEDLAHLDNVWLGLDVRKDDDFRFNNETSLFFTNWAEEMVTDKERHCVQMESGEGVLQRGRWVRANCKKRNAVVCERIHPGSVAALQDVVFSLKLEVARFKEDAEKKLDEAKKESDLKLEYRIIDVKKDAEQKINDSIKESDLKLEHKIIHVKEEAEQKINDVKKEAVQKISDIKKDTEQKINDAKTEARQKIIDVKNEAEKKLNESTKEADLKLEQKLSDAQKKVEQKIDDVKKEAEQKLNESTKEADLKLEQKVSDAKEEVEQKLDDVKFKVYQKLNYTNMGVDTANQEIIRLRKRIPVPIGFIYTQLPGQDPPSTLWPGTTWKDIGSSYSGIFFRAEGGNAAPFGQLQEDNTRRLAQVYAYPISDMSDNPHIPSNGTWSGYVKSGRDGSGQYSGLTFRLTTGEVRPKNKSVKIWLRIN